MEDTLRDNASKNEQANAKCLNPCFNGRYSQSLVNNRNHASNTS